MPYEFRAFPLPSPIPQSPAQGPPLQAAVFACWVGQSDWRRWTLHATLYDAIQCANALDYLQRILTPQPSPDAPPQQTVQAQPEPARSLSDEDATKQAKATIDQLTSDPNAAQWLKNQLSQLPWTTDGSK